jgi:hypothetical protein
MQSERVGPARPHISMSALIAACPKVVRRLRMTRRMSAADLAALRRACPDGVNPAAGPRSVR